MIDKVTTMLLGCIADDFTGATDLALMLVREGMRTVQLIGVGPVPPEVDAVVVALKSRTIPAPEAVAQSLAAAEALLQAGARQLMFKYCSTFDSTDEGNIGPVAEALLDRLKAPLTVATPAFPTNGRRVFQGYLFVGRELLSESCSAATRGQGAAAEAAGLPSLRLSPEALADGRQSVSDIFAWAGEHLGAKPILVYSTAAPDEVSTAQSRLGRERAPRPLEGTLAAA